MDIANILTENGGTLCPSKGNANKSASFLTINSCYFLKCLAEMQGWEWLDQTVVKTVRTPIETVNAIGTVFTV